MISDLPTATDSPKPMVPHRERLSSSLRAILGHSEVTNVTLNDLLSQTGGRGLYLLMILLCLPFISPIPLPGLSNVIGPVISLLAIRLAFRLPPHLPRFIGAREISRRRMRAFVAASAKFIQMLEGLARPRHSLWLDWPVVRFINALILALMGMLLALPIPPMLPFTNSLPCWAIIVMALAIMEADGVLIFLGYAIALGTLIYLVFFAGIIVAGIGHLFNQGIFFSAVHEGAPVITNDVRLRNFLNAVGIGGEGF